MNKELLLTMQDNVYLLNLLVPELRTFGFLNLYCNSKLYNYVLINYGLNINTIEGQEFTGKIVGKLMKGTDHFLVRMLSEGKVTLLDHFSNLNSRLFILKNTNLDKETTFLSKMSSLKTFDFFELDPRLLAVLNQYQFKMKLGKAEIPNYIEKIIEDCFSYNITVNGNNKLLVDLSYQPSLFQEDFIFLINKYPFLLNLYGDDKLIVITKNLIKDKSPLDLVNFYNEIILNPLLSDPALLPPM